MKTLISKIFAEIKRRPSKNVRSADDANKRKNSAFSRKYYVVALTDETQVVNPFSFEVIRDETVTAVFEKILPPEITSAQMLYQGKQISATNKVRAGEYFRIVVGAKSFS